MRTRSHRSGALFAGGLLLAMPMLDVLAGGATPGVPHAAVSLYGAGLLASCFLPRLAAKLKAFVTDSPTDGRRH